MEVFCSHYQSAVLMQSPAELPRVLPLPTVLDSYVVALLHLLLQEQPLRPVMLDASGLNRIHPVAALLLASTLRNRCERGAPVQIVRMSYQVRRRLKQHALLGYVAAPSDTVERPDRSIAVL